jgi:hypothetical protein
MPVGSFEAFLLALEEAGYTVRVDESSCKEVARVARDGRELFVVFLETESQEPHIVVISSSGVALDCEIANPRKFEDLLSFFGLSQKERPPTDGEADEPGVTSDRPRRPGGK